ncbi:CxxxxCH/CxxCH domain-containing protein [Aeromonas hydrophila]|uniref:CxxxxCH/CxxCH domain-containing protein n=1 Tax=Aeromonas hydrophila TaxID=644 RepID=UPI0034E4B2AB
MPAPATACHSGAAGSSSPAPAPRRRRSWRRQRRRSRCAPCHPARGSRVRPGSGWSVSSLWAGSSSCYIHA